MKGWRKADRMNIADFYTLMVYKLQAETKYKVTEFFSKSVDYGEAVWWSLRAFYNYNIV